MAHGKSYDLPFRNDVPEAHVGEGISQERVAYFATILGAEGHFSIRPVSNGFSASVCMTSIASNAELLLAFGRAFGGSIVMHRGATGQWVATNRWKVHGKDAFKMASILSEVSSPRQHLFEAFIKFSQASDQREKDLLMQEFNLLDPFSPGVQDCIQMDAQVAALFDACGACSLGGSKNSTSFFISHRSESLLISAKTFLQSQEIGTTKIHPNVSAFSHRFSILSDPQNLDRFLRLILPHVEKKRILVSVALDCMPLVGKEYSQRLRKALFSCPHHAPGHISTRMDEEWERISADILRLQRKAPRAKRSAEQNAELAILLKQRDSHKLSLKHKHLRSQARRLIQSGAVFSQVRGVSTASRRSFSSVAESSAIDSDPDFWMKRRHDRYRFLVDGLTMPRPDVAIADGVEYGPLPYHFDGVPEAETDQGISPERLRELAGFFAGDGCVAIHIAGPGSSYFVASLTIASTHHRGERCLDFLKAFGGRIYSGDGESGLTQAKILWRTQASTLRRTAELLSSVDSPKRKQLEVLAKWPDVFVQDRAFRSKLRQEWIACRREPADSNFAFSSREQFGGFLDACLSINVPYHKKNERCLLISVCNSKAMIEAISKFLQSHGLPTGSMWCSNGRHVWACQNPADSKVILQFAFPYIKKQRRTVEAALTYSGDSIGIVREQLLSLCDNNGILRRSDPHLYALSWKLGNLKQRTDGKSNFALEIGDLKRDRDSHMLQLKTKRLRERACDLLSRGAEWCAKARRRKRSRRYFREESGTSLSHS